MVINQAYLFFIFTLLGLLIGLLFDFFRVLRIVFKTSNLVTYIEDLIFWIITGLIVLYSIFRFNNGEIRLFMFLGIGIGIIIYILIFSIHIVNFNVVILTFATNITMKLLKILLYPIKFSINIIKNLTKNFIIKGRKLIKCIKK